MTTEQVEQAVAPEGTAPTSDPVTEVKETDSPAEKPEGEQPAELTEEQKKIQALERKISRQTAANREQQRQYEEARKRIAEYEEKLAASQKPRDDRPKEEDFETHEAFTDALSDWKLSQKEKAKEEKAKEPDVNQLVDQKLKIEKAEAAFRAKEDEFRKATPDYDKATEVINGLLSHVNPNHPATQAFSAGLMSAPNPPALIHHLGTHPDVAIRMMQMTPFEIQETLTEIIEQLDAPKTQPKPTPATDLPVPPSGLKGSGVKASKPLSQLSGRELVERFRG